MDPTICACIPHRDYIEYLPDTLDSLCAQTYPIQQIAIVDDGSEEKQWQQLIWLWEEWSHRIPRLHILRVHQDQEKERSLRIPYARNRAFEALRGRTPDYIFFPDADDQWHPTYVEKCIEIMELYPNVDFVYPDITIKLGDDVSKCNKSRAFDPNRLLRQCYITCCTVMRTEAFLNAGMWPEDQFKKEYVFWNTLAQLGHKGQRLVGKHMFYYVQHPGQRHNEVRQDNKEQREKSRKYISKRFEVDI